MRFSELEGASVGVWGAGREVRAFAAELARRLPTARIGVAAFDEPQDAGRVAEALGQDAIRVVSGEHAARALERCDAVVRSPGVPAWRPELVAVRDAGVTVTTATSLWLAERGGRRVIGVSGTKGKSTTAMLAQRLLAAAGLPARLAGNIGVPAIELLDVPDGQPVVVELSSYQIADLAIGPEVVALTNLFREHLDWHGSEDVYRRDKLRVVDLEGVRACVLNAREPAFAKLAPAAPTSFYGAAPGWDVVDGAIVRDGHVALPAGGLPLRGEHNALNLCAGLAAVEALGVEPPPLEGAVAEISPLPHRLELVLDHDGVTWVDDSISTTPESTLAALASFPERRVVLLGGGQDRGQDYDRLADALVERGATVIGMPTTGARLLRAARRAGLPGGDAVEVADIEAAVELAARRATPGSVVLLSPAAPSYDNYASFEERGERFRELVARIASVRPRT